MPTYTTPSDWTNYKEIINNFHNDAFQQDVIWRKCINWISEFSEDDSIQTQDITIKGLVNYNDYRSWPVTIPSITGDIDGQSCLLYLNVKYLRDNDLVTGTDHFQFDPGRDRFILDGKTYKAAGESKTAQASDEALLQFIILKREETMTADPVYP